MLGEKIGEGTGVTTGQRVVSATGAGHTIEVSARGTGILLGVETQESITYEATMRPDGTVVGHGVGVVMGKGGEHASWVGHGVGTMRTGGAVSWRGAFFYQTLSQAWKRLNSSCVVFEAEIDPEGNHKLVQFEWR